MQRGSRRVFTRPQRCLLKSNGFERSLNFSAPRCKNGRPVAKRISGKTFKLSTNTLGLGTLTLRFNDSAEAQAELLWNGRNVPFRLGLDGVERFSINQLNGLPQAAKGEWLSGETFLLHLDLVGGINYYQLKLTFSEDGKSLKGSLTERTGLNDEQFEGSLTG